MNTRKVKIEWLTLAEYKEKLEEVTLWPRVRVSEYPKDIKQTVIYTWTDNRHNIHFVFKLHSKINSRRWETHHYAIDAYAPEREDIKQKKQVAEQTGNGKAAWNYYIKCCGDSDFPYDLNTRFSDENYKVDQYRYHDSELICQWLPVYTYDQNSCYPWFLTKPLPIETEPLGAGVVEEGQCGFVVHRSFTNFDEFKIEKVRVGESAHYRFPLKVIESVKNFALVLYKLKQLKWEHAKPYLSGFVGMLKYKAPFIRAYILGCAKEYIQSVSDENTIINTVDSIVSLTPRPDLDIGSDIGQFKEEYKDCLINFTSPVRKAYKYPDGHVEIVCAGAQESLFTGQFYHTQPRFVLDGFGEVIEQEPILKPIEEYLTDDKTI